VRRVLEKERPPRQQRPAGQASRGEAHVDGDPRAAAARGLRLRPFLDVQQRGRIGAEVAAVRRKRWRLAADAGAAGVGVIHHLRGRKQLPMVNPYGSRLCAATNTTTTHCCGNEERNSLGWNRKGETIEDGNVESRSERKEGGQQLYTSTSFSDPLEAGRFTSLLLRTLDVVRSANLVSSSLPARIIIYPGFAIPNAGANWTRV
jgi:hypothetical protein